MRAHLLLLRCGDHGTARFVVLLMDMDQWTTHVRKANGHGPHRLHSLRTWVDGMDERWKLDRLCCEAAVVDTYDGSRAGTLCHVLKNRRSPDERGQR